MIITNCTPDKYFMDQLVVLVRSIKQNSPKHMLHVFFFTNKIFDLGELILHRIELIKKCMEEYRQPIAWIDADVIVRKDLSKLLDIEPNQLKILFRPNGNKNKFNAGVFNIGYSEYTYRFICDWHKGFNNNMRWGMGQLEMWRAYLKNKNNIELIKIPESFNDLGGRSNSFDDASVIWHCKGNHFNEDKYQKEFQKYKETK